MLPWLYIIVAINIDMDLLIYSTWARTIWPPYRSSQT